MKVFIPTAFSLLLLPVFIISSAAISALLGAGLTLLFPLIALNFALSAAAKPAFFVAQKLFPASDNNKTPQPTQQTIALFILTPLFFLLLLPLTFPVIAAMIAIVVALLIPALTFCFYSKTKEMFKTTCEDEESIKHKEKEQSGNSYTLLINKLEPENKKGKQEEPLPHQPLSETPIEGKTSPILTEHTENVPCSLRDLSSPVKQFTP